jgi:hypothetical protein
MDPASLAGFLAYFDGYIRDHNLLNLLRSETPWNDNKEIALNIMKQKLIQAPMRTLVNFSRKLHMFTDASRFEHVESRYQKWFYEEKLHKDDYTRYLHKIFDSKKDQNEAYKIIQAASSHDSLEEVVKRLVDHFRIHSQGGGGCKHEFLVLNFTKV